MTLRNFVIAALFFFLLPSCERHHYEREIEQKDKIIDLGPVGRLLYTEIHLRAKSILLFRDSDGWAALSTRCTLKGCDLTLQDPTVQQSYLICPCCHTQYNLGGKPYAGYEAKYPLPWLKISYKDGHLYAHPSQVVEASERFTTPEIEKAVRKLRVEIRDEHIHDGVEIPDVLLGSKDPETENTMFDDGSKPFDF